LILFGLTIYIELGAIFKFVYIIHRGGVKIATKWNIWCSSILFLQHVCL